MATLKAGTFLLNREEGAVALVYREALNDYSFPKGHVEAGETLEETAVRETAEETKRDCELVKGIPPYREEYVTPKGEHCSCSFFFAFDRGPSDNKSEDTHPMLWVPIDEAENLLSYENLKKIWREKKETARALIAEGRA